MTYTLLPLSKSNLQTAEFGQFLTRFLKEFDESLIHLDDEISASLLVDLRQTLADYDKAQEQVDLSKSTTELTQADEERDSDLRALLSSIRVFQSSRDAKEQVAFQTLTKIFDDHKKDASSNYEKESAQIKHLLEQLKDETVASYISLLGVERFVSRLTDSQDTFEAIYHNRSTNKTYGKAAKTKELRQNLGSIYQDLAEHIAIGARRSSKPAYADALTIVNRTRKKYAETLAKRSGTSKAKAEKTDTPTQD